MPIKKKDRKQFLETIEKKKTPKLNPEQKLSLCMIVKDEEKFLPQCLKSVEDVVDEIIIVDTGSSDNTIQIAKEFGANVYYYKWEGDFGKARNESLKYATGNWILVLDADEVLSDESKENLRTFLVNVDFDIKYFLRIKNLNDNNTVSFQNYMIRLFKNTPETKFVGKIHESVISNLSNMINISDESVSIIHYGYKNEVIGGKNKYLGRNMTIIEDILKDENIHDLNKGFYSFYLGLHMLDKKELDLSIQHLKESIKLLKIEKNDFLVYPYIKLMEILFGAKRYDELKEVISDTKDNFNYIKNSYEFWYFYAALDFNEEKYTDALEKLKKCVEVYNDKSLELFRQATFSYIYFLALYSIITTYIKLDDKENALKSLKATLLESREKYSQINYELSLINLFSYLDEYDEAISLYENLMKKDTHDSKVKKFILTQLSNIYLKTNQFAKAIKTQSEIQNPENVKESWYHIIKTLEDEKFFPAAEEAYSAIIDVLPEEVNAFMGRAVARLIQNKAVDALSDLAFAKKYAKNEDEILKLGLLYLEIGQLNQSKNCLQKLADAPENYLANLYMANIEQLEGNIPEAKKRLEVLIDLFPDDTRAYIQLGNLFVNYKLIDPAITIFEKLKEFDKTNPYVYYVLTLCYLEKNNKDNAKSNLDEALKLAPNDEALLNLKKAVK